MATVPIVQLAVNSSSIQVFWEVDLEQYYRFWNLYWDTAPAMGTEALAKGNIPNNADVNLSKHHVVVSFVRPEPESTPLYLRIKGILVNGTEDTANPSAIRYIPSNLEVEPMLKQKQFGYDPDTNIWRPIKVEKDTDPSIAGVLDVTP